MGPVWYAPGVLRPVVGNAYKKKTAFKAVFFCRKPKRRFIVAALYVSNNDDYNPAISRFLATKSQFTRFQNDSMYFGLALR